jgi:hypothetical protein
MNAAQTPWTVLMVNRRSKGMNATVANAAALLLLSVVTFSQRETSGAGFPHDVLAKKTVNAGTA